MVPLFKRGTKQIEIAATAVLTGDFELALPGLLGEGTPLSASSSASWQGKWVVEYEAGRAQPLTSGELV